MKNIFLIVFSIFAIHSYGQNKTYWMKKFKEGTLYISFVKNDSKFGTHTREYFTGTGDAMLYVVKYSIGKYKYQTKNGWSNKTYLEFKNGKLVYTTPQMGAIELKKVNRSDTPSYLKNVFFKRKVVRD